MRNKISPWAWVPTLYFAEGLPNVIVTIVSLVLYKQLGLSNAEITFYTSWLNLPWVVKPLWSPFVDAVKTKRWWVITMQLLIGASLGGVAFTIPTSMWLQSTLFFFWIMAFSSATHDIAADGFYMLELNPHDQTFFVGIRSTFYRLASIFGQGVLVMIAGNIQVMLRGAISYSWSLLFYGVAGIFIALWLWHNAKLPRPKDDTEHEQVTVTSVLSDLGKTISSFFSKFPLKETIFAFLFMLLYRMPEGLLVKVSSLFLIDSQSCGGLGLSPAEYGFVQGTVGVIGLTLGGILGGIAASRDGLKRWLWPMTFAITIPNITYVFLAFDMPDSLFIINLCVFIENLGYGFGFSAYMLFMIFFSQGEHKTSHYALCTGFMALSMMLPGLFAGALAQTVGYQWFFVIVMISCLLPFVVASFLRIPEEFGKQDKEE